MNRMFSFLSLMLLLALSQQASAHEFDRIRGRFFWDAPNVPTLQVRHQNESAGPNNFFFISPVGDCVFQSGRCIHPSVVNPQIASCTFESRGLRLPPNLVYSSRTYGGSDNGVHMQFVLSWSQNNTVVISCERPRDSGLQTIQVLSDAFRRFIQFDESEN